MKTPTGRGWRRWCATAWGRPRRNSAGTPQAGESELTGQLRGDLIRALGTVGDDANVQARAVELFARPSLDANVVAAVVAIMAHVGDAARYEEFAGRFRQARTPQEEQRYLLALAGFRPPELIDKTLARTLNGEVRTQDSPFLLRALLMSVDGRERAWKFLQDNWERLNSLLPPNGIRRVVRGGGRAVRAGMGAADARLLRGEKGQSRRQETGTISRTAATCGAAGRARGRRAASLSTNRMQLTPRWDHPAPRPGCGEDAVGVQSDSRSAFP